VKARGVDPVVHVEGEMRPAWGPPETKHIIRWPVTLRVGHE